MNAPVIKLSSPATREFWEIPVLFEDEHLLALNKPPLLPTNPDHLAPDQPSLMALLHAAVKDAKPWATARGLGYLMNAHRLEAEASGVLLLARSKPVLVALAAQFGTETPLKTYVALIRGRPDKREWEIDEPVAPHPGKAGLAHVDRAQGKHARTRFALVEDFGKCSLVRCQPLTDRPHQIRAHLRWAQTPIVGDVPYGGRQLLLSSFKQRYRLKPGHEERPLIRTAALHLEQMALAHPVTGAPLNITAPWPKDLEVAVKYLRRYAGAWAGPVENDQ